MKIGLTLVALLAAMLVGTPAFAEDGRVPQETLSSLGLGDLEVMSDVEGTEVRGRFSAAGMVKGTSLIVFQLLTPDTKNFVTGSSVNEVDGNVESTAFGTMTLTKNHLVFVDNVTLSVEIDPGYSFLGIVNGNVGGIGSIAAGLVLTP